LNLAHWVPGGSHTYSKGDRNYPPTAPPFLVRGQAGHVWDASGRRYVDWSMGINNVLVGHAEPAIDDAAIAALRGGQAFGRPSDLEFTAASAVLSLFPHGEMIKFCKNGSDANNAAVRLARAVTGRQHIAFDGTAPFFSTADWFCGAQPRWAGTLDADRAFALTFRFNDVESVERVFAQRPLACVVLELCRTERPTPEFLEAITTLCRQHGTLLVVDEVVTGYRYGPHGAAALFGVEPDLFTLGKGIANGYSVAALAGKREYMKRGGEDVFLLSTTNGAERSGLAAAIATAAFYQAHDVCATLEVLGHVLAGLVEASARRYHLAPISIRTDFDCRPRLRLPDAWRETFHATLLEHGVLWPYAWCCPCYRRTADEMEQTRVAIDAACAAVAQLQEAA